MKIDLTEIARIPGAHSTHQFEEPLARNPDVELVEPATGSFTVTSTGNLLVLRGKMRAVVRGVCGRCCDPADIPIEAELSEEFSTRPAAESREDRTIDVEEPEAAAFHENILDLTELVRQNIIVNLPLRVLCRWDCPGVCPRCGAKPSDGPCGCPPEPESGPLADLAKLIRSEE